MLLSVSPDDKSGDVAFVWERLLPPNPSFAFAADPDGAPGRTGGGRAGARGGRGHAWRAQAAVRVGSKQTRGSMTAAMRVFVP